MIITPHCVLTQLAAFRLGVEVRLKFGDVLMPVLHHMQPCWCLVMNTEPTVTSHG